MTSRQTEPSRRGTAARSIRVYPSIPSGSLKAPPSKSYTHRALVAAFLSKGRSRILGPLVSEDTVASIRGVTALGGEVARSEGKAGAAVWTVQPGGSGLHDDVLIDAGESGTTLRLFAATAALFPIKVRFDGEPGLARRPMEGLLKALRSLGAETTGPPEGMGVPFTIKGPVKGSEVEVESSTTSQNISGMLLALPVAKGDTVLRPIGTVVSAPYISATVALMRSRGIKIQLGSRSYSFHGDQSYRSGDIEITGDASSASYPLAAGALGGSPVEVKGIAEEWPQADLALLGILEKMGASISRGNRSIKVKGPTIGTLRPFDYDVTNSPDIAPILAVLAAFANGTSIITGGSQLKDKESDRRLAIVRLASEIGAQAVDDGTKIVITGPGKKKSLNLLDISDHRVFMSAVVAAMSMPEPSLLSDCNSVAKSYPGFLEDMTGIGLRFESAN